MEKRKKKERRKSKCTKRRAIKVGRKSKKSRRMKRKLRVYEGNEEQAFKKTINYKGESNGG